MIVEPKACICKGMQETLVYLMIEGESIHRLVHSLSPKKTTKVAQHSTHMHTDTDTHRHTRRLTDTDRETTRQIEKKRHANASNKHAYTQKHKDKGIQRQKDKDKGMQRPSQKNNDSTATTTNKQIDTHCTDDKMNKLAPLDSKARTTEQRRPVRPKTRQDKMGSDEMRPRPKTYHPIDIKRKVCLTLTLNLP